MIYLQLLFILNGCGYIVATHESVTSLSGIVATENRIFPVNHRPFIDLSWFGATCWRQVIRDSNKFKTTKWPASNQLSSHLHSRLSFSDNIWTVSCGEILKRKYNAASTKRSKSLTFDLALLLISHTDPSLEALLLLGATGIWRQHSGTGPAYTT